MMDLAKNKAFIEDPDHWPRWPVLPVINRSEGNMPRCAIMIANSTTTIYLVNMYNLPEDIDTAPKLEFDDITALLLAGWEVD